MGPFEVTFNDFFWFVVVLVAVPPLVRFAFKLLGWLFRAWERMENLGLVGEAFLLRQTRRLEWLLGRGYQRPPE